MATATRTTKGFSVTCPHCHDEDATVSIDLNDLGSVTCSSCDETFTPAEAVAKAAELLARWEKVARWVEMAAAAIEE